MSVFRSANRSPSQRATKGGSVGKYIAIWLLSATLGCASHCHFFALDDDDCIVRRERPAAVHDLQDLAREVTALEDDIHQCGSITAKQPDVWGDVNLMSYIQEYEQVMVNRLGDFQDSMQSYIARSDQAELQSTTSLGAALTPRNRGLNGGAGGGASGSQANSQTTVVPVPFQTSDAKAYPDTLKPIDINTTSDKKVFDVLTTILGSAQIKDTTAKGLSLEPTESLRQNSTYLRVNQGLRRLNTGDDNSQAPGYGLYLLRVPVSIMPGRKTREGYSGVVTMRAQMVINANHLRVTFPKLVFADLADTLVSIYENHWKDGELKKALDSGASKPGVKYSSRAQQFPPPGPVTLDQAKALYGECGLIELFNLAKGELGQKFPEKVAHDELRQFIFSYLLSTYKALDENGFFTGELYPTIPPIGTAYVRGDWNSLCQFQGQWKGILAQRQPTISSNIGWMVVAQASLLERQLKEGLKDVARSGHLACAGGEEEIENAQFANSQPPQETIDLWSAYVQSQYPLHIFDLDPKVEEQNVFDAFSRRRELQLAIAFAVATGNMRIDRAMKYTRQLALDMATIDLNRTQVSFAHGDDTFGWYFYPRVQSPPEEMTNIGAICRTLWATGPTRAWDLRHRHLEPGIRECEVLLVMPNFVPELKLDITTNWERLNRPGASKLAYEDMVALGSRLEQVRACASHVHGQGCYRAGDYERLLSRIDQLEKMLPLQTYSVNIPYQYDLPGRELFDKGTVSLQPVITSAYGINFITRNSGTDCEFFLTGSHFHPTRTHVIVGGKESHSIPDNVSLSTKNPETAAPRLLWSPKIEVISRNLIKVKIQGISSEWSSGRIPVRVATPGGLSNEYEIDPSPSQNFAQYGFQLKTTKMIINYQRGNKGEIQITRTEPEQLALDYNSPIGVALKTVELTFTLPTAARTPYVMPAYDINPSINNVANTNRLALECGDKLIPVSTGSTSSSFTISKIEAKALVPMDPMHVSKKVLVSGTLELQFVDVTKK